MRLSKLLILASAIFMCQIGFAQTASFMHGGVQRTYILHLPTGFSASETLPLVLNLHGLTQTGQAQSDMSKLNAIADRERFIVVHADGLNLSWNAISGTYYGGVDDVGFLSALIDTINRDYHINLNRVYSTGMSNGGFMSYRLACELSHRIAAIASVTGTMTDSMTHYCNPSRPVPVLHFHGTTDPVVSYTGGGGMTPVMDALDYWVNHNNCPASFSTTPMPNTVTTDNCTVSKLYWGMGDQQSEVIHYKVIGGGHTWPGSGNNFFGLVGNLNDDVNASEIIWEFFNRHSLQGGINSVNEAFSQANSISVFPNPVQNILNIEWNETEISSIQLTDVSGRIITETIPESSSALLQLSVNNLPSGIYLLHCTTDEGTQVMKVAKE